MAEGFHGHRKPPHDVPKIDSRAPPHFSQPPIPTRPHRSETKSSRSSGTSDPTKITRSAGRSHEHRSSGSTSGISSARQSASSSSSSSSSRGRISMDERTFGVRVMGNPDSGVIEWSQFLAQHYEVEYSKRRVYRMQRDATWVEIRGRRPRGEGGGGGGGEGEGMGDDRQPAISIHVLFVRASPRARQDTYEIIAHLIRTSLPSRYPVLPDLLVVTNAHELFDERVQMDYPPPHPFESWRDVGKREPLPRVLELCGTLLWKSYRRVVCGKVAGDERDWGGGGGGEGGGGGGGGEGGGSGGIGAGVRRGEGITTASAGTSFVLKASAPAFVPSGAHVPPPVAPLVPTPPSILEQFLEWEEKVFVVAVSKYGWELTPGSKLDAGIAPCTSHIVAALDAVERKRRGLGAPSRTLFASASLLGDPFAPPDLPFRLLSPDEISGNLPWLRNVMTARGAALDSVAGCKRASWDELNALSPRLQEGDDKSTYGAIVSINCRCVFDDCCVAVDRSFRYAIIATGIQSVTGEEIYVLIRPSAARQPHHTLSPSYHHTATSGGKELRKRSVLADRPPRRTVSFIVASEVRNWTNSTPILPSAAAWEILKPAAILTTNIFSPVDGINFFEVSGVTPPSTSSLGRSFNTPDPSTLFGTLPPLPFQYSLALRQRKFFVPRLLPLMAPIGIRFSVSANYKHIVRGRRRARLPTVVSTIEDVGLRALAIQQAVDQMIPALNRRPESLIDQVFRASSNGAAAPYELRWLLPLHVVSPAIPHNYKPSLEDGSESTKSKRRKGGEEKGAGASARARDGGKGEMGRKMEKSSGSGSGSEGDGNGDGGDDESEGPEESSGESGSSSSASASASASASDGPEESSGESGLSASASASEGPEESSGGSGSSTSSSSSASEGPEESSGKGESGSNTSSSASASASEGPEESSGKVESGSKSEMSSSSASASARASEGEGESESGSGNKGKETKAKEEVRDGATRAPDVMVTNVDDLESVLAKGPNAFLTCHCTKISRDDSTKELLVTLDATSVLSRAIATQGIRVKGVIINTGM